MPTTNGDRSGEGKLSVCPKCGYVAPAEAVSDGSLDIKNGDVGVPPLAPPPGSGGLPPSANASTEATDYTVQRKRTAFYLGMFAILGGAGLIIFAACKLPDIPSLTDFADMRYPEAVVVERYYWVAVGAHLVHAIATFWYLYQLLRVAERLGLPLWMKGVSAKDILGIETPYGAGMKFLKDVAGLVKGLSLKDDVPPGGEP